MRKLFKSCVLVLSVIGLWNLFQAIWAYHSFPQNRDIAYLRSDSQPVELSELLCGDQARQGTQLLDMAILAAAAYPSVEASLLPKLSNGWEILALSSEDRSNLFSGEVVSGLHFGIWFNSSKNTAVISFRGTDDVLDWHANLHWFTKIFGINTQYQKVNAAIPKIVKLLKSKVNGLKNIHVVGHSLGGGLAQHALYSHVDITQAFVFNSSPVTGWNEIDEDMRSKAVAKNIVTRIHEDGEILEFFRLLMKVGYTLNPRPNENPFFEEYRFNFKENSDPRGTHKMPWLARQMIEKADAVCDQPSDR